MAEKKTYRKECEYCKTEYVAQSPLSKTCSDSCRKALSRARKSDSVTNCDSVTVTPEIEQPRVPENELKAIEIFSSIGQTVETAIQKHPTVRIDDESAKMIGAAVVDGLTPLLEEFMKHMKSGRVVTETISMSKTYTEPETDDGFRPMTAAEREADMLKREAERATVVVQVKENEKTDGIAQSSTNFMSMIANMQSGKEGW